MSDQIATDDQADQRSSTPCVVYWRESGNRWLVQWIEGSSMRYKSFSISFHGKAEARRKAIAFANSINRDRVSPLEETDSQRDTVAATDFANSSSLTDYSSGENESGSSDGGYANRQATEPVVKGPGDCMQPVINNTFNISDCKISFFCAYRDVSRK